jgi:hypothetical protein
VDPLGLSEGAHGQQPRLTHRVHGDAVGLYHRVLLPPRCHHCHVNGYSQKCRSAVGSSHIINDARDAAVFAVRRVSWGVPSWTYLPSSPQDKVGAKHGSTPGPSTYDSLILGRTTRVCNVSELNSSATDSCCQYDYSVYLCCLTSLEQAITFLTKA